MGDAAEAYTISTAHGAEAVLAPVTLRDEASGQELVVSEIKAYGDCVLRFVSGSFQVRRTSHGFQGVPQMRWAGGPGGLGCTLSVAALIVFGIQAVADVAGQEGELISAALAFPPQWLNLLTAGDAASLSLCVILSWQMTFILRNIRLHELCHKAVECQAALLSHVCNAKNTALCALPAGPLPARVCGGGGGGSSCTERSWPGL